MATIAEQVNAEFLRIQQARNDLRTKGVELGITNSAADIDDVAAAFGGIVDRGNVNAQVKEGETYTIQPGYHRGGTVAGVSGGGSYELQEKTVTPTKTEQVVTSDDGYYGMSKVVVNPIPENYQDVSPVTATAPKVLVGSTFVDSTGKTVPGSMPNNGQLSKTLDATTGNQSYTPPEGYTNGGEIKIVLEEKSVTPTKSAQTVTPTAGKVLSKVSVSAIPAEYQNVTPVTAGAPQVLTGYDIVDASGAVVPGSMLDNGLLSLTFDPLTQSAVNIPAGYTSGGSVAMTDDLLNALKSI